jgi:response regulator of citrate/malate metabolism
MENNNQLSEIEREELEYLRLFASYVSVKNIELAIDFVDDFQNIKALQDEWEAKVDGVNFIRWLKSQLSEVAVAPV